MALLTVRLALLTTKKPPVEGPTWEAVMAVLEIKPDAPRSKAAVAAPPPEPEPARAAIAGEKIALTVADIVGGARDSGGEKIDFVYFKRHDYAIYRRGAPPQIVVAYADDIGVADQQIAAISGLLPLRDHLLHLIDYLLPKSQENYRAQMADALRLGLEKQVTAAQALLGEAIDDALAAQARRGRLVYLQWTALAIVPALVLIVLGGYYAAGLGAVALLLMSIGAGAIGAVLSIAIGIRARTVAIEGDWRSNAVDAAVRVAIGMISAAMLFLLLNSGIVADISAGGVALSGGKITWQVALIIGFAAGFLERLVPDLLEKSAPSAKPSTTSLATGGAGVAPPNPK